VNGVKSVRTVIFQTANIAHSDAYSLEQYDVLLMVEDLAIYLSQANHTFAVLAFIIPSFCVGHVVLQNERR
jgi:hypothetical protein